MIAATAKKQKRRRVKHMEGLLTLARLPVTQAESAQTQSHAFRPAKRHVLLQPQLLQVAFSAQVHSRHATLHLKRLPLC